MADPYQSYLSQAQALFESGDVVKAGQIWQAILKREPGNTAARNGLYRVKAIFDARATQDGLGTASTTASISAPAHPPEPANRVTLTPPAKEINSLLEAGCALYDAGLLPKAISTWEMALTQDPGNALAKGYIDGARRKLEAERAPSAPPESALPPPPEPDEDVADKLLRDGCTLFDMGQTEDALKKWERILERDPNHPLALAYANGARADLGLPPFSAVAKPHDVTVAKPHDVTVAKPHDVTVAKPHDVPGAKPAEIPQAAPAPQPSSREDEASRADQLVREGVQIYDMGMVEEAIAKWSEALALEPGHRDAPGYLEMARREREQAPPSRPARPPALEAFAPAQDTAQPSQESRILSAENLLHNQKFDEAAYAFQRLMEAGLQDSRVLQGYQQARAFLNAREAAPTIISLEAASAPPVAVGPPRALTIKAPARAGLKLPSLFGSADAPAWLENPRNAAVTAGAILVLGLALYLVRSHQRDVALKDAVAVAKANALAPIARRSLVVPLAETPQDILHEGERALSDDPLTAYYRAQECVRLDPGDTAAAQLLERARARCAAEPPKGSGADLDKTLKSGDLPAARSILADLLRVAPDDTELKAKARTIYLALVLSHVSNEHFSEAREVLCQGRAMFPQDKTWSARLKLLEEIRSMGKGERVNWIPLLG